MRKKPPSPACISKELKVNWHGKAQKDKNFFGGSDTDYCEPLNLGVLPLG